MAAAGSGERCGSHGWLGLGWRKEERSKVAATHVNGETEGRRRGFYSEQVGFAGAPRQSWMAAFLGFHASDTRRASVGSWYGHRGRWGAVRERGHSGGGWERSLRTRSLGLGTGVELVGPWGLADGPAGAG